VTINGLAIVNDKPNPGYAFHTQPPGGLPEWYRQNVIGDPGAFLRVVEDFHSFADAMTNKLVSEIAASCGAVVRSACRFPNLLTGLSIWRPSLQSIRRPLTSLLQIVTLRRLWPP
jgi:Protein of unknown function (DUF1194)